MFTLRTKFPNGMKIFAIPLSWFRKVSAYLNNICPGTGMKIEQPGEPSDSSPVIFSIDTDYLDARISSLLANDNEKSTQSVDIRNNETDTAGTMTLETNSWAANNSQNRGVIINMITRFYTTPNTSRYHFLMYRELRFSAKGQLLSVSAEKGYAQIRA